MNTEEIKFPEDSLVPSYSHYARKTHSGGIDYYLNMGCYSGLGYILQETEKLVVFQQHTLDTNQDYVNWILQESLYKDVFLTKTYDELTTKGCEIDISYPFKIILGALIALRSSVEWKIYVDNWQKLVDLGYTKDESFCLMLNWGRFARSSSHMPLPKYTTKSQYEGAKKSVQNKEDVRSVFDMFGWQGIMCGKRRSMETTVINNSRYDCLSRVYHIDENKVDKIIKLWKET